MFYKMPDGKVFWAVTPECLVKKMRNTLFIQSKDPHEYMKQVCERIYILYGLKIEITDERDFVDKLIEQGIIQIQTLQ